MIRRITVPLLALMLITAFAVHRDAVAGWYCEGRRCATNLSNCCCEQPAAARDGNCDRTGPAQTRIAGCAADCGCVMVITDCDHDARLRAASVLSMPVALLAPAPPTIYATPCITPVVLLRAETRGPPDRTRHILPTGLRAPPTV